MKKKNLIIIAALLILGVIVFKPNFLSIISEKNLIIFYNGRDSSTTFSKGDPLLVDTTFVQQDLDVKYNNAANANGKDYQTRAISGQIIWVDNKIYSVVVGGPTAYGWTACQNFIDWGGHGTEQGICTTLPFDNQDCQARLRRAGCLELYSENYLNKNNLPVELMTQQEKNELVGCHDVRACVGRSEHMSQSNVDYNPIISLEHTCTDRRICWDGTTPVVNPTSPPKECTPGCDITC